MTATTATLKRFDEKRDEEWEIQTFHPQRKKDNTLVVQSSQTIAHIKFTFKWNKREFKCELYAVYEYVEYLTNVMFQWNARCYARFTGKRQFHSVVRVRTVEH